MTPGTALVALGAPAGRTRWTVERGGARYAVFVLDGEVVVTDAACPHKGGPLVEGVIRDGAIVCPWHWYTYDLRTGRCRTADSYRLRKYPVVDRDGALFAEVPVGGRPSWSSVLRAHAAGRPPGWPG